MQWHGQGDLWRFCACDDPNTMFARLCEPPSRLRRVQQARHRFGHEFLLHQIFQEKLLKKNLRNWNSRLHIHLILLEESVDHPCVPLVSRIMKRRKSAFVHGVAIVTLTAQSVCLTRTENIFSSGTKQKRCFRSIGDLLLGAAWLSKAMHRYSIPYY